MSTTKSLYIKMAFVLDADKLRQLDGLLEKNVMDQMDESENAFEKNWGIGYRVDLSDGTTKDSMTVDDVVDLPNSIRRSIKSIRVSTPYGFEKIRATVSFKDADSSTAVNYDLAGEDKEVVSLSDKLDDYLLGVRPWYSVVSRYGFFGALTLVNVVYSIVLFGLIGSSNVFLLAVDENTDASDVIVVNVLTILVLGVLGSTVAGLLAWLLGRIFPTSTFAIGQGAERHKRLNTIRFVVLTVVVLPIPVGLLVSFLS